MPIAPAQPCITCGVRSDRGNRCKACRARRNASIDQARNTATRTYNSTHTVNRILCFQRDSWKCQSCGWQPKIVTDYQIFDLPLDTNSILAFLRAAFNRHDRHLHADHILTIEHRPDLKDDLSNYATLCSTCHNRKTMKESVREGP